MGSLSDYAENELLDHLLKIGALTVPTNLYVALSTADPLDDASGLAEPSGGGYARVNHNAWKTNGSRAVESDGSVTFAAATASWGTITHFAIVDALTGGNMLAHGSLSSGSFAVDEDDVPEFADGAIDVSVAATLSANFTADSSTDVITATGHGLTDGKRVVLSTTNTLPAGLSAERFYFVRDATTDTFKLSLTSGGTAIDLTDNGTGTHTFATAGTLTDYAAAALLQHLFKIATFTVPTNVYVGLSQVDPADDGSGLDEPDGHGYARVQTNTWNAASGGASANTGVVNFAVVESDNGTVTVDAGTDVFTSNGHGLADDEAVVFTTTDTLPAGLSANTPYFVRDSTTNTFKVSATKGGSAVDVTDTGTGTHSWQASLGKIVRLTLHDASTGGNLLASCHPKLAKLFTSGHRPQVAAGGFDVLLS